MEGESIQRNAIMDSELQANVKVGHERRAGLDENEFPSSPG